MSAFFLIVFAVLTSGGAHTHGEHTAAGEFASGFLHPLFDWGHVVAMFVVGLWGEVPGALALWLLPDVFPVVMALGGTMGVTGAQLPAVESGMVLSGVALGLLAAFAIRAPLWVATPMVGAFAVFHWHAHDTELPTAADPINYVDGLVIATGLLHLAGIGIVRARPMRSWVVRNAGALVASMGAAFLCGGA